MGGGVQINSAHWWCIFLLFFLINTRFFFFFLTGNPLPNVTWYKDGVTPLQRKLGAVRYTNWAIVLEDLVTTDSGNYMCKVCNENGCIDFTYKVDIIGKPGDIFFLSYFFNS